MVSILSIRDQKGNDHDTGTQYTSAIFVAELKWTLKN